MPSRYLLTIFLPMLFALGLRGDTIELKTGERIEGTFKQATSAGVVIQVGGQSITIPLEKVRAIYFGVVPTRTVAEPARSQEAMDALKALRSVTESGISYRDYAPRVLDAKVKIDRYLSSAGNDPPDSRKAIETAMREYELASMAWNIKGSSEWTTADRVEQVLEKDPEISKCPGLKRWLDQELRANPFRPAIAGFDAGENPSILWTCASAQIAEAERLIAQH
jgi:hypothetical protein